MIFAGRESNIANMLGFRPRIIEIDPQTIRLFDAKEYRVGDTYSLVTSSGTVISTTVKMFVCVEKNEINCARCPYECPFNKNPSRKES